MNIRQWLFDRLKPSKAVKKLPRQDRRYVFVTGVEVLVRDVVELTQYATGCQMCRTVNGEIHVIPPWWKDVVVEVGVDHEPFSGADDFTRFYCATYTNRYGEVSCDRAGASVPPPPPTTRDLMRRVYGEPC